MAPVLPLTLALLISLAADTLGAPQPLASPSPGQTQTMNLTRRRRPNSLNETEWGVWAKSYREGLQAKYSGSGSSLGKRGGASGTNLLINQDADSSYIGSIAVGTPPVAYNVILDTGSADLWLASAGCEGCGGVPVFDSSESSSFENLNTTFQITYGSGQAEGVLGSDVVQMAGFSVSNQVFAVCDQVSSNLLNSPVSGLMGLAFKTIASSHSSPFWETLASSSSLASPLMAFQLTRFINQSNVQGLEPGGTFTLGAVDTSLYTGEIEFQDIPNGQETYWTQQINGVTVQGNSVTVPSGSNSYAAIDTGTTLIGGPSSVVSQVYAQIPGSSPGTGNNQGYYTYPCSTDVTLSLSFGGSSWPISPDDFKSNDLGGGQCVGALFEIQMGSGAPAWIVGDTFLKNVYTVFRFSPASVGFAALSQAAGALSNLDGQVPSPTIGSVAAAVTNTGDPQGGRLAGGAMTTIKRGWREIGWAVLGVVVGAAMVLS